VTAPDVRTTPDGLCKGGEWVWAGDRKLGRIFPRIVAAPSGEWWGKRFGVDAHKCDSRQEALDFVTRTARLASGETT